MRLRALASAIAILAVGLAPLTGTATGATDVAGVPAAKVGVNGPTENVAENLRLVGHADIRPDPSKDPLGNNGGLALIGDCAFVGRWHDYGGRNHIQIVDIAPASATYLSVVGEVAGSSIAGGVSREIRGIDLPNFKMLSVLVFSQSTGDRSRNKMFFYTFENSDCRKPSLAGTYDMGAFRGHEFFQWLDPDPAHDVDGHPRVLEFITAPITPPNVHVVDASDPSAPRLVGVFDAGQPVVSPNELAGTGLGKYAHSISISDDGTEAYLSYWDGGFFTMDTTSLALGLPAGAIVPRGAKSAPLQYPLGEFGNTHSAVRIPGTRTAVLGDEIYISTDGCPFGWLRTVALGDEANPPRQIGEFRLAENRPENCERDNFAGTGGVTSPNRAKVLNASGLPVDGTFTMHNQTTTPSFTFASWYGGGLRVVDVRDPATPTQAGMFVPEPVEKIRSIPATSAPIWGADTEDGNDWWVAMWSYPIIRDGLIYVVDMRNGLYILEPAPDAPFAAEVAATRFAEGNSNFGALAR